MSIETLRIINQRLKPIDQKVRQLLRIGQVLEVSGSELSIAFSEIETIKNVPFLALHGLQIGPKKDDSVLVYSPQGKMDQAIAIAVVTMGQEVAEQEVRLASGDQTLGVILKGMSDALQKITSPGFFTSPSGPVTPSGAPVLISTKGFK